MSVSSSSASVVVSPANVDVVAAVAIGKLTTFVSRLSRDEKKKELPPEASRMSAEEKTGFKGENQGMLKGEVSLYH